MINFLRIGKIITLHGIKGEVKVYATTDDIKRFDVLKKFYLSLKDEACDADFDNAEVYELVSTKYIKNCPILKIKGFDSIEASTKLIGCSIYVKREDAIKLNENEFYIADLIGLDTILKDKQIGTVKDVLKTKANSILVVTYEKKDVLIPLVYDFIEKVDLDNNKVFVKTIEGLF